MEYLDSSLLPMHTVGGSKEQIAQVVSLPPLKWVTLIEFPGAGFAVMLRGIWGMNSGWELFLSLPAPSPFFGCLSEFKRKTASHFSL